MLCESLQSPPHICYPASRWGRLFCSSPAFRLNSSRKTSVAAPHGARGIWVGLGDGEFREQVTLPGEVDADKAHADYQDGILTLTLPKAEHARIKTIKVGAGGGRQQAIAGQPT